MSEMPARVIVKTKEPLVAELDLECVPLLFGELVEIGDVLY